MDTNKANAWSIGQSIQTYAINFWGEGYFSINEKGNVSVKPDSNLDVELDLFEIARSLEEKNLSYPVLVRFTDILQDRVNRLNKAFQKACANYAYQGRYTRFIR